MADDITVTALGRTRHFKDVDALAAHVTEVLEHRGGIYDPMELAAIRELARVANGQAPEQVHRIARKTAFHSPADRKGAPEPTPFDEDIQEGEEAVEEAEVQWIQARRTLSERKGRKVRALAAAQEAGTPAEVSGRRERVRQSHAPAIQEAEEGVRRAREDLTRSRSRLNALKLGRDRWRQDRVATYHNPADPDTPLTAEEFREG